MPDVQDLDYVDYVFGRSTDRYVCQGRKHQLAGAGLFPLASAMRRVDEAFAPVINGLGNLAGHGGIIAPDVPGDAVEVLGRRRRPSQTQSGLQYLRDVGPDFRMLHELTALGGGDAKFHTFTKAGVVLQQPQGGILHQLFRVGAAVISNLRKVRFLFRGENGLPYVGSLVSIGWIWLLRLRAGVLQCPEIGWTLRLRLPGGADDRFLSSAWCHELAGSKNQPKSKKAKALRKANIRRRALPMRAAFS